MKDNEDMLNNGDNKLQDNPSIKQLGDPMPPPSQLLGKRKAPNQMSIEFDPNSISNPSAQDGNQDNEFDSNDTMMK